MNTALKMAEAEGNKPKTMHEALSIVADAGYNVDKLTPASGGMNYFWDQKDNEILFAKD